MNTTELRESFQHIHAYQDWQRQCEALTDVIDGLRSTLEWYADPINWRNRQGMIQATNILDDAGNRARDVLAMEHLTVPPRSYEDANPATRGRHFTP